MTCVRTIAQAEESVKAVIAATLSNVSVWKTGKGRPAMFLTVSMIVVFLIEAFAIQVMTGDALASRNGRVPDVQFLYQLTSHFGLERNILT